MSKLTNKEIDLIVDTYKTVNSIAKTVEITGFSKTTVNKYVLELSSLDIRSRNKENKVLQLDMDGNQIKEWFKPSHAAKELNINLAEITRVLKGELNQAGGFRWVHKE